VTDRFFDCGHSGFFDRNFVQTYWCPLFKTGYIVDSAYGQRRPRSPWWIPLLEILPLRYMAATLLLALLIWVLHLFR
jgi:hypothetical protein